MELINKGKEFLICEYCKGTGNILPEIFKDIRSDYCCQDPVHECWYCNGTGRIVREYLDYRTTSKELSNYCYSHNSNSIIKED